jgi:hypothetical protein
MEAGATAATVIGVAECIGAVGCIVAAAMWVEVFTEAASMEATSAAGDK